MQCEVLVVGGGPAGSTAARFLADNRIETILVERDLSFNKPCGGGIPSAGLKELELLSKIANQLKFNTVTKVKIFPPFSAPIEVSLKGGEIFIFNRQHFDSFLRDLAEKSGVKILEAELINIEEGRKKKSIVKTKKGDVLEIYSKYIIAADGVNSRVCSIKGLSKPEYYWTVSLNIPEDFINTKDTCEFWFGNSHASFFYSWVFPCVNYFSIGTGAEEIKKLYTLIKNFIERRFNKRLDINCFKLRAYKIPRWNIRIFFKDNIILCGDALGTVMPVSFEGIYYSMKSAQFAAEAIIQNDLNLYKKLWEENFLNQFRLMKKFQDYMFGNDERIDRWLNIHRNPVIQELAMALWLRKERGHKLIPLYLKAFGNIISRIASFKIK